MLQPSRSFLDWLFEITWTCDLIGYSKEVLKIKKKKKKVNHTTNLREVKSDKSMNSASTVLTEHLSEINSGIC